MSEIYEKIDDNNLQVTRNDTSIHIFEENRAEIQTQIDHLRLDKNAISERIDALGAKIAILDEEN